MATVTKKDKFFEVLRNIFVGAKIEGNSGYVNLMKIKSKYYNEFKEQLHIDIDAKLKEVGQNFEEELYNKLFTFFKKYFSESGSIYFSYTPLQEKVYERIYRDDKDVMLFWKTHMLYYVKTERLFKNMELEDEDIIYIFDVAELEHKKSNEKKDLVFDFVKAEHTDKRRIYFSVKYSKNGSKTKTEEILKTIKKEKAFGSITLKQVERVLGIYKRQSEVDYFINKDAKGFLKEQFSLWIKGYLLDDGTLFEPERLNQLKALQEIAFSVIDLVGQFEDELVKVWNKPKFVHSSNYVITLDKIAEKDFALLEKILKHKGIAEQVKEWNELELVDKKFDVKQILNGKKLNVSWQYLILDTKYFKELELNIISLFDDLDNQLDGILIKSENFQGLKNISPKYYGKIQTTYIDPPFNTGDDFEYADNYQDSTWLSIMQDRIELCKRLLNKKGSFFLHLDDNADFLGRIIMNNAFEKNNYRNNIIWTYNGKGLTNVSKKFIPYYSNIFFYSKSASDLLVKNRKEGIAQSVMDRFGKLIDENNQITFGKLKEHNELAEIEKATKSFIKNFGEDPEDDDIAVDYNKGTFIKDIWDDIGIIRNSKKYKESVDFSTQKPEKLLFRVIESTSEENDIILDFFSGSATTIVTAHKMKRKWIGIEMGNHFDTVVLPRLKECLSVLGRREPCGITKDVNWKGGGFFKYYSLEQYEETLSNIKYEDKGALPTQDIYHQYLFLKDLKLADDVIKLDEKSKSIKVDLTKLHPAIDIPETLSHLTGKFIKQIKKDEVVFTDGTSIDLTNIDYKIVKPLIWW
jgi:adenine specific DNA methylase Mod